MPDSTDAVASALPGIDGVEVHGIEGAKVVITIEAATVDDSYDRSVEIQSMDGVVNVALVYVNFEDDPTIYPDGI